MFTLYLLLVVKHSSRVAVIKTIMTMTDKINKGHFLIYQVFMLSGLAEVLDERGE